MEESQSVRTKKLYKKIKDYEIKGEDIKLLVEELGFAYSAILPADLPLLSSDGARQEIIQLRVDHHEIKRMRLLQNLVGMIQRKRKASKSESSRNKKSEEEATNLSGMIGENSKESIEINHKRRIQASERALKLKFNKKVELMKRIQEKQLKSIDHHHKYITEIREKIDKFQREEKNKYENVKQNTIVLDN